MMKAGGNHVMDGHTGHDEKTGSNESCPMMKDGKAHQMHSPSEGSAKPHSMHSGKVYSADGKSGCSCCNHSEEKKDAPAV